MNTMNKQEVITLINALPNNVYVDVRTYITPSTSEITITVSNLDPGKVRVIVNDSSH